MPNTNNEMSIEEIMQKVPPERRASTLKVIVGYNRYRDAVKTMD